jgi:hypothetical protein
MTAREIMAALAKRHPAPAWAFLEQVRNGTGWARAPRTADALAMSCWPSRGLELHGFEVKVSRGDWIRELAEPAKAEEILSYCDRWWLVTPAKGVMQEGELPPTWGHMVVDGRGASIKTPAPAWRAKPLDRIFLAAILRKVHESHVSLDSLGERLRAEFTRGKDEGTRSVESNADALKNLTEKVQRFEAASGVSIARSWEQSERIGAAVRQVLEKGPLVVRKEMENHRAWLAGQLRDVDRYLVEATKEGAG